MFGLTRRDLYAFYAGNSVAGMLIGLVLHVPTIFLVNGLLLAFDIYMFKGEMK